MQTFLPYPNFVQSAKVLDWRRLGKQRVEAKQILNALQGGKGWSNHPATKMWAGCEPMLAQYGLIICLEWRSRGYKDTLLDYFLPLADNGPLPSWFGKPEFHAAHRSNLLRKDSVWYGQFGWNEPNDLEYLWG